MKRIAVIIPAYNEGARIGTVLSVVQKAKGIDELIVVSDGSRDNTVAVASSFSGVKVIDLARNVGKGGAMAAGVQATTAEIVAFIDADLEGLKPEHVEAILEPMRSGLVDMCVGIFRGGRAGSSVAMATFSFLSGQRAMTRSLFESVPGIAHERYGVEVAITNTARRRRARVRKVILKGVSNCYKEEKLGLVDGIRARSRMYREIRVAMVKSIKKPRSRRKRPIDY
jgi:polyisoprenyl-phosphate glycosyltransferase